MTRETYTPVSLARADTPGPPFASQNVDTQSVAAETIAPSNAVEAPVNLIFTGSGAEYFRIWAVNLTLTICSLGIYSAWAKVRRLRYFYNHTVLDGSAFDYTASPLSILFGRLLALIFFVLYYFAFDYSPHAGLTVTLLLASGLPYLLWQSNRFKARNTRFRGLEFGFGGSLRGAYQVYAPAIMIAFGPSAIASYWIDPGKEVWFWLITVAGWLALPIFHALYRQYLQRNLRFGDTKFNLSARGKDFAQVWAWGIGATIFVALFAMVSIAALAAIFAVFVGQRGNAAVFVWVSAGLFIAWLTFILIGSYFTARFQSLVWDKTKVGGLAFHCQVPAMRFIRIQCMNTLWVILSLGLYRPFAAIRLAAFRLECVSASGFDTLDTVAAGVHQSRRGAMGESAAELFELDIGL